MINLYLVEKQEILLMLYSLTNLEHTENHNLISNLDLDSEMVITCCLFNYEPDLMRTLSKLKRARELHMEKCMNAIPVPNLNLNLHNISF